MLQTRLQLFPEQASTFAEKLDQYFWFLFGVSSFFAGLIVILITVFAIRYRRRPGRVAEQQQHEDMRLELFWTLVPTVLVFVMFVWSARLSIDQAIPPIGAEDIYVIGKQWM